MSELLNLSTTDIFCVRQLFGEGPVPCIVGCITASLASLVDTSSTRTHSCDNQKCHQISWHRKSLSWMMMSCTTVGISDIPILANSLATLVGPNFRSYLRLHLPALPPGKLHNFSVPQFQMVF